LLFSISDLFSCRLVWPANPGTQDFGGRPINSNVADSSFRSRSFLINQTVSTLDVYVWDITGKSEILIDDLVITDRAPNAVPEPGTLFLLAGGLFAMLGLNGRLKPSPRNRAWREFPAS
jgi:hypothetical protein